MTNRELMKTNKLNSMHELLMKLVKFLLKERSYEFSCMESARDVGDIRLEESLGTRVYRLDKIINKLYFELINLPISKEERNICLKSKLNCQRIENEIDIEYDKLISSLQFEDEDND